MYSASEVRTFIRKRELAPDVAGGIEARLGQALFNTEEPEMADKFSSSDLDQVMGSPELGAAFRDAWEKRELAS